MVKQYQNKTITNKEVAIQARERNSSSLTQSQVARRSSTASMAAVVVQFNNDLPKSENVSPDQISSPMKQRLKNESQLNAQPQPSDTVDDLLAMRTGSVKHIVFGSNRQMDHEVGTQYGQLQDQPSQTSVATVINEADREASRFANQMKKHSQLKPT